MYGEIQENKYQNKEEIEILKIIIQLLKHMKIKLINCKRRWIRVYIKPP